MSRIIQPLNKYEQCLTTNKRSKQNFNKNQKYAMFKTAVISNLDKRIYVKHECLSSTNDKLIDTCNSMRPVSHKT